MKRILTTLFQKWPEYLREMIVITAGILGAFVLNNWNEERKNQLRSENLLKSLRIEVENNRNQLEEVFASHQMVKNSSIALLNIIRDGEVLEEDSLKYHVVQIGWGYTFDPQNSTLYSAISSGDIHTIRNDSLLHLLFSWMDISTDLREEEIIAKNYKNDIITPFTHKFIMEADIIESYYDGLSFTSHFASDYSKLVYNREFENHMSLRLEFTEDVMLEIKPLIKLNEKILTLIDQSLN